MRPAQLRRPAVLGMLVLLALAVSVAAHGSSSGRAATARPNIVVVMTDDQTLESLRVMKNVRQLGARGTTFANSIVSLSLCCPSRATFLTGQYAHNHRVWGNDPPTGGYAVLRAGNTLATWLKQGGYRTALVGKYLNGYGNGPKDGVPPGWDEWRVAWGKGTQDYFDYWMNENGSIQHYGNQDDDYKSDVITAHALDVVDKFKKGAKPFFLWLAYNAPHQAIEAEGNDSTAVAEPAPRHEGRFANEPLPKDPSFNEADVTDKPPGLRRPRLTENDVALITKSYRAQLESLLAVDEGVGRLVAKLRKERLLDRTVIIFTSDNGFMAGQHRWPSGKILAYEPSLRVPLLMAGPGIPKRKVTTLVANIDLAPTIAALARVRPGLRVDGSSLLPLLREKKARERSVLIESPINVGFGGLRTSRYLFVRYRTSAQELYDLRKDPFELNNLAYSKGMGPRVASLRKELARLRSCAGATCRSR